MSQNTSILAIIGTLASIAFTLVMGLSLLSPSTVFAAPTSPPQLIEVAPTGLVATLPGTNLRYLKISGVTSFNVQNPTTPKLEIPLYISAQNSTLWVDAPTKLSSYSLNQLNKTLLSFLECGVVFNPINVLFFDMNAAGEQMLANYANQDPYAGPFEVSLFGDFPLPLRPMAVLARTGIPEAFNLNSVNRYKDTQTAGIDTIANIAFVPGDSDADYYAKFHTQPSFSLLAHELTHVTGNLEHITTSSPNLMSNTTGPIQSGDLNPGQCDAIVLNHF